MRNRDGRYNLMFEEWVTDGPFVISPRITFEVRFPPLCALGVASPAHGVCGGVGAFSRGVRTIFVLAPVGSAHIFKADGVL